MIGIHTPETTVEHEVGRLRQEVKEARFEFPVVIDNENKNWSAWGNSMWPSVYLIDKHGDVRYWWYGELKWQGSDGEAIFRKRIGELLAEK